jgi:cell division transport system ATP-binding protein
MIVEFRDVDKIYEGGRAALRDVSFSVGKGEFVFLVGPSGAGKTTLLRHIYMEEFPSAGDVEVGDYDSTSIKRSEIPFLRRKIGVVFQDFRLLPDLTAFENVAIALRAAGKGGLELRKRVNNVLYTVGLASRRHLRPGKLSGGEQQRVAIARAIALRPAILLADEPTGNLDPDTAGQIFDLLADINRAGTSTLVATHDYRHAERLGKRVIRIVEGRITSDGGLPTCTT